MTKQEEIRDGIKNLLEEDWITKNNTHENPPPGKDCGESCGVEMDDQIAAANPFTSPLRSGGAKHRACVDCWNEYIDNLITKIFKEQDSQGVVVKVEKRLPPIAKEDIAHIIAVRGDMTLQAGYAIVRPLIEEKDEQTRTNKT